MARTVLLSLVLLAACTLIPACSKGPPPILVKGTVLNNGQPLKIDSNGSMTLMFDRVVEKGETPERFSTRVVQDSGAFEITGKDGKGVPPGKYKIGLVVMLPKPTAESEHWNQAFSGGKSPIMRDITSPEPLTIDLAKEMAGK
jgi:hypothetical protein